MGLPSPHVVLAKEPNVVCAKGSNVVRAKEPNVVLVEEPNPVLVEEPNLVLAKEPNPVLAKEPTGAPHLARFSRDVGCRGTTPATFTIYEPGISRFAYPTSREKRARCPWLAEILNGVSSQNTTRPYTMRVLLLLSAVTATLLCAAPATGSTGYRFQRHLGQPYLGNHRRRDQRSR